MTTRDDADLAVLARIGGNEYRRMIELGRARGERLDQYVRENAASLAAGESYLAYRYHDVWRWTDTEGREHLNPANVSGPDYYASKRPSPVAKLPEAAFDWPIYRAAMQAETYAIPAWPSASDPETAYLAENGERCPVTGEVALRGPNCGACGGKHDDETLDIAR